MRVRPRYVVYLPLGAADLALGRTAAIESCGGLMALRALAATLARIDGPALLAADLEEISPEVRADLRSGEAIAVYPEGIPGNPLRARRRIRWVLYHVDRTRLRAWERAGDTVWFYWPQFHPDGQGAPVLTVIDADLQRFQDRNGARAGVCFRTGKGGSPRADAGPDREEILHAAQILRTCCAPIHLTSDDVSRPAERLPDRLTLEALADAFNRTKMFVSYDTESATSVLAALCGCVSVILPPSGISRALALPCFDHGVAWGWEELPRAVSSLPGVRPYVADLLHGQDARVQTLIAALASPAGRR